MQDVRDVHDLVALMSVEIVLDSLANICVSKPKGEVFVVALQLDFEFKKIRLTIAENDNHQQNPAVVAYLTMVWNMLRVLASQFESKRAMGNNLSQWDNFVDVSPPIPQEIGRQQQMKIFRQIYCYTREKNRTRIDKYWDPLHTFMNNFYQTRTAQLEGYELDLDTAYQALRIAFTEYKPKPSEEQDETYWKRLFALLEVATNCVTRITGKNNYWYDTLVVEETPTKLTAFNLRHALQKITSQH
ncbi:hypothetical protein B9Z19DRAFT_1121706 [Tuber borchii]|uniref:Uncharacterized protein n=1 Tax=Tuber borchii TaxID=42251 RepID=A0A2T7A231_TUBBO|nr:hypothetical protein B9Z19DRAFT_1121706 [Tuber borchii]